MVTDYLQSHYDSKKSVKVQSEISGCIHSKRFRRGDIMYCKDASRLLLFVLAIFCHCGLLFVYKVLSALASHSLKYRLCADGSRCLDSCS